MDELQFLNIEYPQSRNRIDDKCNLTWNNLITLLNKYEEHKQIKNNVVKSNVNNTVYSCGKPCPYADGGSYYKCRECTEHK